MGGERGGEGETDIWTGESPSISMPSREEWIGWWTGHPSHRRGSWERRRVPRSNSVRSCSWHLAKITHRPCQPRPLPDQQSPCLAAFSSLSSPSREQHLTASKAREREGGGAADGGRQEDARECQEIYFKLRVPILPRSPTPSIESKNPSPHLAIFDSPQGNASVSPPVLPISPPQTYLYAPRPLRSRPCDHRRPHSASASGVALAQRHGVRPGMPTPAHRPPVASWPELIVVTPLGKC